LLKYNGIAWYYYQGALLPKVPPNYEVYLSLKEQKELLRLSKALFLRYTNEWDRNGGEFWYIIKDAKEELETYKSKIRSQIKRGLKNCLVSKVDTNTIANNGYEVYINAFKNYSTNLIPVAKKEFAKDILDSTDDFWAVYDRENTMIGYAQNILLKQSVNYASMKFHPNYLKLYPSYALIYYMNEYYLNAHDFSYVSDGARSIAHDTNIQDFLIQKFCFRKAYCKLNVSYRWDIGLIVSVLYPFRSLIYKIQSKQFKQLAILLKQETIRRSFE